MDEATQLLCDAIQVIEESVGATINWAGEDYPCAGGAELGGKMLGAGGYRVTAQVPIVVRIELFEGAIPQEKQTLTHTSAPGETPKKLRIDSVTKFRGAFLQLDCNDQKQGA